MTVLYFADTRFPIERANGAQTMATCHALAARGHDVTLVVRPDTAPVTRDPFAFYGLPPIASLKVESIPAGGSEGLHRGRFLLGALARCLRNPQAVIYTRDLGLAAWLVRLPGMPRRLVYETHGISSIVVGQHPEMFGRPGLEPSQPKLDQLERRERRVWQRAAGYIAITRGLADDLAARFGPRRNVVIAPDGANEPQLMERSVPKPASTASPPVAAYAGHLYPWKGVDVFVRALAQAPAIRGLIIGGHPKDRDRERIDRPARDLGVTDRLEMTGLVAPPDVASHLARADMLVLPNTATAVSERYTSPLKLFEYLWMGRPIVASNLPAIREVLTDGSTALLVPPDDAEALASALNRLAADRGLAQALGEAARRLAPSFTWAARAAKVESALQAARA